jgi:hypothetical protein
MSARAPEVKIAVVGFPVFLIWEILQSPFYTDTFTESWHQVVYNRIHCAIGDLMILLGAFWFAALIWGRAWIAKKEVLPVVALLAVAVIFTIVSEYRNVHLAQNWAYSEWMPTIGGIGLFPVVQWIVIPFVIVHILRQRTG